MVTTDKSQQLAAASCKADEAAFICTASKDLLSQLILGLGDGDDLTALLSLF